MHRSNASLRSTWQCPKPSQSKPHGSANSGAGANRLRFPHFHFAATCNNPKVGGGSQTVSRRPFFFLFFFHSVWSIYRNVANEYERSGMENKDGSRRSVNASVRFCTCVRTSARRPDSPPPPGSPEPPTPPVSVILLHLFAYLSLSLLV